jgi:hypothetical protein
MADAQHAVRDALGSASFSPDTLETSLANLRTQIDQAQDVFYRSLIAASKEMTPEERRSLAATPWFSRFERGAPRR